MSAESDDATDVTVVFDLNVFKLDAIKAAAYRFSDRFTVDFKLSDGAISCRLHPLKQIDGAALAHAFRAEVLDQDLRRKIAVETAPIRNLVLSLAFSKVTR